MRTYLLRRQIEKILSEGVWSKLTGFDGSRLQGEFLGRSDGKVCYFNESLVVFSDEAEAKRWHNNFLGPDIHQTAMEAEAGLWPGTLTEMFNSYFDQVSILRTVKQARSFYSRIECRDKKKQKALRFLVICSLVANSDESAVEKKWLISRDVGGEISWIVFGSNKGYLEIGRDTAGIHQSKSYRLGSVELAECIKCEKDWMRPEQFSWYGELDEWPWKGAVEG